MAFDGGEKKIEIQKYFQKHPRLFAIILFLSVRNVANFEKYYFNIQYSNAIQMLFIRYGEKYIARNSA